jgi:hypothetical protein
LTNLLPGQVIRRPVTAGLSDIDDAERAGELLSPTLREDTRGEVVLVTRRRGVI